MTEIPTVKVMPSSPEQGEFVVINEADFDPAVHRLYGEAAAEAPAKTTRKRKKDVEVPAES